MFSPQSRNTPIEIRLRVPENVIKHDATAISLGLWHPDTPHHREKLAFAANVGNDLFGPDTHQIEERPA